jgi:hypothetical protein
MRMNGLLSKNGPNLQASPLLSEGNGIPWASEVPVPDAYNTSIL